MKRIAQSWNRSGSGPAGPNKTGRKFHPAGRNRIFAGFLSVWCQKWTGQILPDFFRFFCPIFVRFLPDFCQFDVKNEPDGFYRTFFDFFAGFLPDWRQKWSGRISTGPDRTNFEAGRTGPDAKNPSGSNSDLTCPSLRSTNRKIPNYSLRQINLFSLSTFFCIHFRLFFLIFILSSFYTNKKITQINTRQ